MTNNNRATCKRARRPSTPVRLGVAAVTACFLSLPAQANPVNPVVVNGTASFSQNGNVLTVTNSNGAIINWDKFSIQAGETTRFQQSAASSSVLNRVLNDPSVIYGTLSSNGRVWLVNPAGILVGPGGRVDTAAFVASTLNIRNEDFLAGRKLFINDGIAKDVINQGDIRTPAGGSVYLIGSNVANESLITTPQGETILAAGATVSLIDSATPGVKVDITGAAGNATNLGTITAEAGRIGIAGVIVRNSGTLNASSVVSEGGRIFLKASQDAYVDGSGRIVTTGTKGGQVEVLGNRAAVMDNAQIDVSGTTGGGTIKVGGDYQGKNLNIQNASITYFGPDASLKANATEVGDGGTVIVWADDTTRAYGAIEAKGGPSGGNGGFVETSGKRYLAVDGARVDTSAAGASGLWLLDPTDIDILGGSGSESGGSFGGGIFTPSTGTSTIYAGTISSNLQTTNVTITSASGFGGNGDIKFDGTGTPIVITSAQTSAYGDRTLGVNAYGGIQFEGQTTFVNATAGYGFAVGLYAGAGDGSYIESNPGSTVTFNGSAGHITAMIAGPNPSDSRRWENRGTVTLNGDSRITIYDNSSTSIGEFSNYGGILNINSSNQWSVLSATAPFGGGSPTQAGVLINENGGVINVNGTALGSTNYTSWAADFEQASGSTLNLGAGKFLSVQNPYAIAGNVVLGTDSFVKLSERHINSTPSLSGANISGPGVFDVYGSVGMAGMTLGGGAMLAQSYGGAAAAYVVPTSGVTYSGSFGYLSTGSLSVAAGTSIGTSGSVTLASGWNGTSPPSALLTPNAANLTITDAVIGANGGVNIYSGGSIALTASAGPAKVGSDGAMLVKAAGGLTISGGSATGAEAFFGSKSTQSVYAASINIQAGIGYQTPAGIAAYGDQNIYVTTNGGLTLLGGAGGGSSYGSYATIGHSGLAGGNQAINLYGGNLIATGGSGFATALQPSLLPISCGGDPACSVPSTDNFASIHNKSGTQTVFFQYGGTVSLTGGTVGVRNLATISNTGTGAQSISYGSGSITMNLTSGATGGNNTLSNDGFHYLRNNATLFSPNGAQVLALGTGVLTLTAAPTTGANYSGAWIVGNGQTLTTTGDIILTAGSGYYGGTSVGISSLAGQSITAGAISLTGGGGSGYDNIATIEQTSGGAYSQSLTATSLTITGGSGNGMNGYTGGCGAACNGYASHNSAGIYNVGSAGQTVNVSGAISLVGGTVGNRNNVYIQNKAAGPQDISTGSLSLQGGNSGGLASQWMFGQSTPWGGSWLANNASITSGWSGITASQTISSAGAITIQGNVGSTGGVSGAGIGSTGAQSITGTTISLTGGTGVSSYESWARIASLGTQYISATSLNLQAGLGTSNRASVSGYGQTFALSSGLGIYGGGAGASAFSNTAEIINFGAGGQSITFSGAATMTVQGGAGSGYAPYGSTECGALCDNLSSWNSAQLRNQAGNQTINFTGGGSLAITGGSVGNDNGARIENEAFGTTQSILGNPAITLTRGASGGAMLWGAQQVATVDHPAGALRWFELTNDAGISSDGPQVINASALTLNSAAGSSYGGTFVGGPTQTLTVTGALSLQGGTEAYNSPIGAATEFMWHAPAVIGYDTAGHSLTINAGSVTLAGAAGAGWGDYGGSPALIGTYKNATDTTINTTAGGGIALSATTVPSVQIGSLFADGGQVTLNAGSTGPVQLSGAAIGTGSSGSTTLIGSMVGQSVNGMIYSPVLDVNTNGGAATLPGQNLVGNVFFNTGTGTLSYTSYGSYAAVLDNTTAPGSMAFTSVDAANGAAGVVSVSRAGTVGDNWAPSGSIVSTYGGSIYLQSSGDLNASSMSFTNSYAGVYGGLVLAASGTLTTPGISTGSALTLSSATLNVNSPITTTGASLSLYSTGTMTLAANVGATTGTTDIVGTAVAVNSGVTVGSASGISTVVSANSLTTAGSITSGGTTSVYVPGAMTMTGGSITSAGATLVDAISLTMTGGSITSAGSTVVDASVTDLSNATVYGTGGTSVVADALTLSSSTVGNSASPSTYVLSGGITMTGGGITSGGTTTVEGLAIDLSNAAISSYGPLAQVNAGNLVMYGSSIIAPNGNATVSSQQNIDLNYSSTITSGAETTLNLYGADSVLNMSWASTVESESPYTINLNFNGRSSGGLSFQGVPLLDAKTLTDANGNGFYVQGQPAVPDTNLFITYAVTVTNTDICVISPSLCVMPPTAVDPIVGEDEPPPPPPSSGGLATGGGSLLLDPSQTTGGETGTFGSETGTGTGTVSGTGTESGTGTSSGSSTQTASSDGEAQDEKKDEKKNEKKTVDGKDEKKIDKAAAKKLAQCT